MIRGRATPHAGWDRIRSQIVVVFTNVSRLHANPPPLPKGGSVRGRVHHRSDSVNDRGQISDSAGSA